MVAVIARLDGTDPDGGGLCTAAAELFSVDGAAIVVSTGDGVTRDRMPTATYPSVPRAQPIEDGQLPVGVITWTLLAARAGELRGRLVPERTDGVPSTVRTTSVDALAARLRFSP